MADGDSAARVTLAAVLERIPAPGAGQSVRSAEAFRHGSLLVKVYAPRGHDPQTPHRQDEIYIVMTGTGHFIEVQGTAEGAAFSRKEMDQLLDLAEKGISELIAMQKTALK